MVNIFWQQLWMVVAGMLLAAAYCGGLWLTVGVATRTRHPWSLLVFSAALRIGLVVGGIWLVSAGQWQRMVFCLAGFVISRTLIAHLVAGGSRATKETTR